MAMTAAADAPPHSHIPSADSGVVKPWTHVVRGDDESFPAVHRDHSPHPVTSTEEQSSLPDSLPPHTAENSQTIESSGGNNGNAGKPKKLAWKRPSNDEAEVPNTFMWGSWPALSESTKASPKSSPGDSSSKIIADGSMLNSQEPVIPHSPQKQATDNTKPNSTHNNSMPARQRSMKRSGSGSGGVHSQSSFTHLPPPPPPPPPFPVFAMPPYGYGNVVPAMPDQSPRVHTYMGNNWEPRLAGGFVPQAPVVTDHRHSPRRGNFGPHVDGTYQNTFRGRREQDRGHHRDTHVQPQRPPSRGFVRHPPLSNAAFVPPQPVRPFSTPMGFPDMVYLPALPFPFINHTPAAPTMLAHVPEASVPTMVVKQIEYYFSDANLFKDNFLKSNMDDEGWVPIMLIAGFNRVKNMTNDIPLILESLRTSIFLEVQDDKVRRRNDWMNWIPSSSQLPTNSGSEFSTASSYDVLADSFQTVAVEDAAANTQSEDLPRRYSSESTTTPFQEEEDTEDRS